MLEEIVSWRNVEKALRQVESNKGACGVDGMQTDELRDFLHTHYTGLRRQLLNGTYRPQAVRKVEIPKPDGGLRTLGIPTVLDRVLQQAISQRLGMVFELSFSDNSFGFRRERNASQAVQRARSYLDNGYTHIVELDLEKFFDRVNHDRLISSLRSRVSDVRVIKLIVHYLKSGILEDGLPTYSTEGTPQGSPLSPLLSNIVLDELDKELEMRGHRFVRYADDCSIYKRSHKAAVRTMTTISIFVEGKLKLKVNRSKSSISRPCQSQLLGFSFYKSTGMWRVRLHPETVRRIKVKVKSATSRSNGTNTQSKIAKLSLLIAGWLNYFRLADAKGVLQKLDEQVRTRLRISIWKEWKTCKGRIRGLIKLGITKHQAYQWGNTSRGYCRVAHSPILCRALNNKYFQKKGYEGFYNTYQQKTITSIKFS